MHEMIADRTIMVDTTGAVVGQINGLAVLDLGDYTFGRPTRITAVTYQGRAGVVNIEREARMSGRTHDKGDADPLRLPRQPLRAGQAAQPVRQHHLRAVVRRDRRRQRLLDRALRAPLQPGRAADQAGDRGHRLGEPARGDPAGGRRDPQDRGVLRRVHGRGRGPDRRAGRDHPRVERGQPDAAHGCRGRGGAGQVPHLAGEDRGRGDQRC